MGRPCVCVYICLLCGCVCVQVGDTILGIIQHLEQAMHLSDGTVSRMATYITPVAKQHASRKMLAPRELSLLQELRRDINSFLLIQEHSASVVLLQAYVRRWIAIKRFKFKKQNFVRQRNEAFTELMRNETEYVLNLATIVDRYLIPLQSTRKHVYDKVKNVRHRARASIPHAIFHAQIISLLALPLSLSLSLSLIAPYRLSCRRWESIHEPSFRMPKTCSRSIDSS